MKLGENISCLRKKNGLSQEKLAEKINVARQTISNWELGETAPNPEQLILLSHIFNKSIDELVGNDLSPTAVETTYDNNILYIAFALIFGIIAGIFSFAANRFRYIEILLIAAAGAAIGICVAAVCDCMIKTLKNKN